MLYICLLYVTLGSIMNLIILRLMFMGSQVLCICSASCVLYSAGSSVKRVHVVLSSKSDIQHRQLGQELMAYLDHTVTNQIDL